ACHRDLRGRSHLGDGAPSADHGRRRRLMASSRSKTADVVSGPRTEPLLRVESITVRFGAVQALSDVSVGIHRGEVVAVSGRNRAGKTTLLNVISGFYHPQQGHTVFQGRDRTQLKPFDVARLGIARTFQNVALFKGMSVLDNIMTGRLLKMHGNFLL